MMAYALLLAASVVVALPTALLLLQVVSSLRAGNAPPEQAQAVGPLAVLMPAHDEALGITPVVKSLLPQLRPCDRLLVVADNCSDDTAQLARQAGAEVIERADKPRRGKGYALDFGVRHLASNPPDLVIILDADCTVRPGSLLPLAAAALRGGCPAQAHYRMALPEHAGLKTRIAGLAWRVKNWVRPLGYQRLGLPCQLMGSGMAFPWRLIAQAELANGHLVEDLKLGLAFAAQRSAPRFVAQAEVVSVFPDSAVGAATQRTRWEHGHLGMMLQLAPPLLWQAVRSRNLALLALAADLCIPPLALLALMLVSLSAVAVLAAGLLGWAAPAWIAAGTDLAFALAVFVAWARHGRDTLRLTEMLGVPLYVLWKVPVYLRFVVRRERRWVRSARGSGK